MSCDHAHFSPILYSSILHLFLTFFFFNDTPTTEIYTLSLHDALPILIDPALVPEYLQITWELRRAGIPTELYIGTAKGDRKSTRLNSSHTVISYAVFCLKKKKKKKYKKTYKQQIYHVK